MSVDTDNRGIGVRIGLEAAVGQLSQAVNGIAATVEKLHKFMTPNPIQALIVRPVRGVVVSDGSTYVFIDLGGPSSGRIWDLRRLAVIRTTLAAGGFADAFTAPANVIAGLAVRVSPVPNTGAAYLTGFDDLIVAAVAANTPFVATWSSHEATIGSSQRFVVVIKGTTSGDQYFASGQAEEYLESVPQGVVA